MRYLVTPFLLYPLATFTQHNPNFLTDGFTPFWNNPAATASWNKFSVNAAYQNEWPSLSAKNQTINLSSELYMTWGKTGSDQKFNMPLGLNVMYQFNEPQEIWTFNLPISIPIRIGESRVAVGLAPGIRQVSSDWSQMPIIDPSPNANGTAFDLNAGIFWYGKNHYVGLSVSNATAPLLEGLQTARHYYAHGGYRLKVGKHHLFPMISASYAEGFINLQSVNYFQFRDDVFSIGLGGSLRSSFIMAATVKIKGIKLAYSYGWTTNRLTNASGGTHEVRLSYSIPKLFEKKGVQKPAE